MRIEIENLDKKYKGGVHALKGVNLTINSGMFGFLGPNGAGKRTLMKILSTLELPSSGHISIDGKDIMKHRRDVRVSLGYLPQFFGVYPQLTGYEFLYYIAKLNGLPRKNLRDHVLKTLESVALLEARDPQHFQRSILPEKNYKSNSTSGELGKWPHSNDFLLLFD